MGRPTEGEPDQKYSLAPVADYLSKHLDAPVRFEAEYLDGIEVAVGELVLLENVRFNVGEKKNSDELSNAYANLCDIL